MKIYFVLIATVFCLSSSIATARTSFNNIDQSIDNGVVKVSLLNLKDRHKKGRIEFTVDVENISGKPLVYFFPEMECARDEEKGELAFPSFGIGERVVNFMTGQSKRFKYICKFERDRESTESFELVIRKIFENPNRDGKTAGAELSPGISMKVAMADE
jgi:hypothetical protein